MWKTIGTSLSVISKQKDILQPAKELANQQLRTTYILRRKHPTQLHAKGENPKTLRSRHYIYEVVEDTTSVKHPNLDVILTSYVEGYGNVGDRVSVRPNFAYNNLLLPGLAVYASPENLEKFQNKQDDKDIIRYSSANALYTVKSLQRVLLSVIMNMEMPWTLKPWHISTSFRKCGYVVPEDTITLPEQPISGPNMDLENKEFAITVTINNKEKVDVRCRIHHWSTDISERIPHTPQFWETPSEPILPEQAPILEAIPPRPPAKNRSAQLN
ncbi:unnamed protein product [Phaedon cochleariae]|uniref:Large ribosomal subunit protein bL9m n=1 Tax=Phaedon cochleariae TaxID=80249 RepID=A0A9P0GNP4_PHACE|nr:unnamed protein product [Phaedon cochleariae]